MIKNLAIIVAAGTGTRFGGSIPKQYILHENQAILRKTIISLQRSGLFDKILITIHPDHHLLYEDAVQGLDNLLPPVHGGATRQESVFNALQFIHEHMEHPQHVYIHDAVRFQISRDLLLRLDAALQQHKAVIPVLDSVDTIKETNQEGFIVQTLDRHVLKRAQTPQAFHFADIWHAHQQQKSKELTDDAAVMEHSGYDVFTIAGHGDNTKITYYEDLAQMHTEMEFRTGIGFDVHAFEAGRPLILCGIELDYALGLKGHSDADVALHAITDALLGAMGKGDIGEHFPPSDMQWKGKDSSYFLEFAAGLLKQQQGMIINVDVIIMGEEPKITPYRARMAQRVAEILGISLQRINVKATTTEKLGFVGRKEGLAAQAVVTVKMPSI